MLVVASVIGAGIFFTPSQVANLLPGAGWILLAWVVGALLSLAGALANAELGAMFPRAGGDYVYLREGIHPAAGFLVGWLSFFAIYAGTIAALAVILGDSLSRALGWGESGRIIVAAVVILACSAVNTRGVRLAARVNNVTSVAKIAAIAVFVVAGPLLGVGSFEPWGGAAGAAALASDSTIEASLPVRFGAALSPILFSFLGWNASVYVASEIRDPQRNVPGSLFLGLGICAAIYLVLNGIYFYALSPAAMAASTDAGEAAATALFGAAGGRWVAVFVLVSVLGTLNATVLVGPRIVYAMALERDFFERADHVHEGHRTPDIAIWVQAVVAIALVSFLETFPRALDFTVFAIVLATSADVVALFALRRRQPGRRRPYRARGYPWVPAIYLVANFGIGTALILERPRECLTTGFLLVAGLLLYLVFVRKPSRAG